MIFQTRPPKGISYPEAPSPPGDELWDISEDAQIPTVISFGKHRGIAIADLPSDYKRWPIKQSDLDPYVREALCR